MTKERVIRLATNNFLYDFKTLFPEVEVFNPERDSKLDVDLLIFSGGEDVDLKRYMDNTGIEKYSDLVNLCCREGVRFSDRLQITVYDEVVGV